MKVSWAAGDIHARLTASRLVSREHEIAQVGSTVDSWVARPFDSYRV